jgi:hypothetical protein
MSTRKVASLVDTVGERKIVLTILNHRENAVILTINEGGSLTSKCRNYVVLLLTIKYSSCAYGGYKTNASEMECQLHC